MLIQVACAPTFGKRRKNKREKKKLRPGGGGQDNTPSEGGGGVRLLKSFFGRVPFGATKYIYYLCTEPKNNGFMATFNYTTREFREKQALILDKVDAGEDIIIHRGIKKSYMLVPVHKEDYTISDEFREKIAKAREDYKAGKGVTCKTVEQSMALLESL